MISDLEILVAERAGYSDTSYGATEMGSIDIMGPRAKQDGMFWWKEDTLVLSKLLEGYSPSSSAARNCNVTDVLVSIIKRSLQLSSIIAFATNPIEDPTEAILECLLLELNINTLIQIGLQYDKYSICANDGALKILGKLLEIHLRSDDDSDEYSEDAEEPKRELITHQTQRILKAVVHALPHIGDVLICRTFPGQMPSLNGNEVPRLGFIRLRLIEIISTLCLSKTDKIDQALVASNVINNILDIFFTYENHSLMQMVVAGMIEYIFEQGIFLYAIIQIYIFFLF